MILKIKDALDTVSPDPELIARTQALMEAAAAQPKKKAGRVVAFPRRAAALAACLLLVIGLSAGVYAYRFAPVSSIYLDAKQSLALEVSRSGNVVGVDCYDSGAKALVAGQSLRGETAEEAVAQVLAAAKKDGSLDGSGEVVSLAVYGKHDDRTQALLSSCTQEIKNRYSSLAVYSTAVQPSLQSEAEKDAISPGRLGLIKMIQKLDGSATVGQYRDAPVSQLVDRLVYLTSDANTTAPATQKAAVRSDIQSVAEKRAAALPAQGAPAPQGTPTVPQQQTDAAPVWRPSVPAATQSVGETGGSQTAGQTQQPESGVEASAQPGGSSTGGTQSGVQQPAGAQQTPSGDGGGTQTPAGAQVQPGSAAGEVQQPGTQSGQTPSAGQQATESPQPGGAQQQTQPSLGALNSPETGRQSGTPAAGQQIPAPSNGDEGR